MRGGHLVARAVLVGALAAGLGLGGCGRKGSLDPPPSASVTNNQPINAPPSLGEQPNPFSMAPSPEPLPAVPSTAPGAPPPPKKTFILDWLLR
jgi:predicted small lipoprotein YifL